MNVSIPKPESVAPENLYSTVESIFLHRRIHDVQRTWEVVQGRPLNKLGTHTLDVMFVFVHLAVMAGLSEAEIGRGLMMILYHDTPEILTGDRNIHSKRYVTVDEAAAFRDMQAHLPTAGLVYSAHDEYEARQTLLAKLVKDADTMDPYIEQMQKAATVYTDYHFVQAQLEYEYKCANYYTPQAKELHKAFMVAGLRAVHSFFLDNKNSTIALGTHGK